MTNICEFSILLSAALAFMMQLQPDECNKNFLCIFYSFDKLQMSQKSVDRIVWEIFLP